ncbi:hypothetical protein PPERSA_09479 [Pseudocohnilembus persalinus]|uniref:Mnd1 HTH domain-containing protein n=1 Tax=Pseudocohnilembus persalinus TaxID=266149 RepID=A0A0V0QQX5_PSEPJ|nr:hypothetical protein PPERSA_09479 [Pseudocohnilembus persalinus]|eukprot:KRX04687.1 hypothetical protein PPERSA_09479 [Pseudocohnilembus persalinus]
MAPKKGLSAEDKRNLMLNYFLDKKEPFKKDEFIKFAKGLGINNRDLAEKAVKELVGENMIIQDKIGGSVFFWAFPHDIQQNVYNEINSSEQKHEKLQQQIENSKQEYEKSLIGREPSEERSQKLEKLKQLKATLQPKQQELTKLKKNSPENQESYQNEQKRLKLLANHWLYQLFQLKNYFRFTLYMTQIQFNQMLQGVLEDENYDIDTQQEYNV